MSNHQKRLSVPNSWPVERKTATFTVKADAGPHGESGVPLLILLRDVLNYVDDKREAQFALRQGSVLINGEPVSDVRRPVGIFDILSFTERQENYRVFPDEGGRLTLTPIDADAASSRLGKVVRKGTVSGGAVQLTLHDGTNLRHEDDTEYGTKDSLVIDNETKEVVAHFPYREGALAVVVDGQHAGRTGEIEEIDVTLGSGSNTVTISDADAVFETVEEYVVIIDENFIEDDGDEAAETDDSVTETDESAAETTDADAEADEVAASDEDDETVDADAGAKDAEETDTEETDTEETDTEETDTADGGENA